MEINNKDDLLNLSVEEAVFFLSFTARTAACLKRNNVNTVRDIINAGRRKIASLYGMGGLMKIELEKALIDAGIDFPELGRIAFHDVEPACHYAEANYVKPTQLPPSERFESLESTPVLGLEPMFTGNELSMIYSCITGLFKLKSGMYAADLQSDPALREAVTALVMKVSGLAERYSTMKIG